MKQKSISVKWKIFFYLFVFGGVMLLLLWIFQVILLDDFYKAIRTQTVKSSSVSIAAVLQTEEYEEELNSISTQNDICITVYDENQMMVYNSDAYSPQCRGASQMKKEDLNRYIEEAQNNQGKAFLYNDNRELEKPAMDPAEDGGYFIMPKGRFMEAMTQISLVDMSDERQWTVFVNSQITPVDATVGTIRLQLLIITVILFLFALLLAFLMSKKIARPIITINDSAKKLASGNYHVQFEGKGYLEIAELNSTLNYACRELAKVEKLRQDLIANMSHDLRTPLTMISGYGEMMRDIPNENSPENVQIIIDEANRLTHMVNDILDLSKIQSGIQELTVSYFNITDMINHDVQRYQKMLEHEGYQFQFLFDEEIYISADESKLNQVIYNLLNNAVHYCGEDRRILVRQSISDDFVEIEVEDHGEGISEEDLPYVWDRYYKVDKTHERSQLGSGLGLSIVRGILELHSCAYGVRSKLHEGTAFWFKIKR